MKRTSLAPRMKQRSALLTLGAIFVLGLGAAPAQAVSPDVVLSQVYGGGGNSGAPFRNDFIELFNRGTTPVSLDGKSVQYASASGTTFAVTNLGGTIEPGQYYLVQEAAGTNMTAPALPTPDATGNIALAAGSGKVALVDSTTALTCGTDCDKAAGVRDFVGYGTATDFEGAAAAPLLTNTTADLRNANGCQDTDNNGADFTTAAPAPRNSSSTRSPCTVVPPPSEATLSIDDVTVTEGNAGATNAVFTVTLSADPASAVTVDFATQNGTATAGSDFTPQTGTLTFTPGGPRTQTINVPVTGDTTSEPNETFTVSLSAPVGATIADGQGAGTITNDDAAPATKISSIQGSGPCSPFAGTGCAPSSVGRAGTEDVTIEGVVTGIDDERGGGGFNTNGTPSATFGNERGIFVQEETADEDGNPETSEGIFVGFVDNPSLYNQPGETGTVVRVTGRVRELFGFTIIEEKFGQEPQVVSPAAPKPAPSEVSRSQAESQDAATRPYYESLESMRVRLGEGTANSGGTNKFEELFLTPGLERDRVFRDEVVPELIGTDEDAGSGNPPNPQDPDNPRSATTVDADLFDTVSELVGPLAFNFSNYKVMVQADRKPVVNDLAGVVYPYQARPDGLRSSGPDDIRVVSFNVENFFDEIDDPGKDDDPREYENENERRERLADAINNILRRPDVIAVQEVENIEVLRRLATRLGGYEAFLEEGNDERGIDVGYLIKDTVTVGNVRQLGKDEPNPTSANCADVTTKSLLFDRPPLAADITTPSGQTFTLLNNHFASKGGPNQRRECRDAQARFVRSEVQKVADAGGQAMVIGDLNAFEDEEPLKILEEGGLLDNQIDREPDSQQRYSFVFQGRMQVLDHVLVTEGLRAPVADFQFAHFDNDYYQRGRSSQGPGDGEAGSARAAAVPPTADGHKVSDHDPPVLTLAGLARRPGGAPGGASNEERRSPSPSSPSSSPEDPPGPTAAVQGRRAPALGLSILGVRRNCTSSFVARVRLLGGTARLLRVSLDGRTLRRSARSALGVRVPCRTLRAGLHRLSVLGLDGSGRRVTRTVRFEARSARAPRFLGG